MWENIGECIIIRCCKCGNDIIIDPHEKAPENCPFCSGEKASKDAVIKELANLLAEETINCPFSFGEPELKCPLKCNAPIDFSSCWIAYVEEQVKNGQG